MTHMATLSSKGQVTIPKPIRDYLALQKMDKLIFSLMSKNTILVKPINKSFLDFGGSIKPKREPENFARIRQKIRKDIARKAALDGK